MCGFSFFRVESTCSWLFLLSWAIGSMVLAGLPLLLLLSLQWLISRHLLLLHLHRQEARQQEKLMLLKAGAGGPGVPPGPLSPLFKAPVFMLWAAPRLRAG